MELSKIEINFKDPAQADQKQTYIVTFALIDKTNPESPAHVYVLKNEHKFKEEDFSLIKNGFISIDHHAFIFIGLLDSLDKKAKKIILTNQNTIFYEHSVIATGSKKALLGYEFLAGIQTLIEALKVSKNNPSNFVKSSSKKIVKKSSKDKDLASNDKRTSSRPAHHETTNSNLAKSSKRLYEIQI